MAEQEAPPAAKPKSWLKTILGTLGGLLSGAAVMYLTPLVNDVVKPAKPVANFSVQPDAKDPLITHFHNISTGGQGWWDFGDGSPLEPASSDRPDVSHKYPRAGDFNVKLSLRNVLNEESERTVTVHLDPPPAAAPPHVAELQAIPLSPGSYAPATFKLVSKVENAEWFVWDFGDERPLAPGVEHAASHERVVTFDKPGGYVVKAAAFNGDKSDQKTEIIVVEEPPVNTITAVLTVTDAGTSVETRTQTATFGVAFPMDATGNVFPFDRPPMPAPNGYAIADAAVQGANGKEVSLAGRQAISIDTAALGLSSTRDLQMKLAPELDRLLFTGELVRASRDQHPALSLPVRLTLQRRTPATKTYPVATTLTVPTNGGFTTGTLALPPLSKDWVDCKRGITLEVRDGDKVAATNVPIQGSKLVTLQRKNCILTTSRTDDQVRIDLLEAPAAPAPAVPAAPTPRLPAVPGPVVVPKPPAP